MHAAIYTRSEPCSSRCSHGRQRDAASCWQQHNPRAHRVRTDRRTDARRQCGARAQSASAIAAELAVSPHIIDTRPGGRSRENQRATNAARRAERKGVSCGSRRARAACLRPCVVLSRDPRNPRGFSFPEERLRRRCEATLQGVLIDPGDEVDLLLDIVRKQNLAVQSHSADACARRSRDRVGRAQRRHSTLRSFCTATTSSCTTPRLSRRRSSAYTAEPCLRSTGTMTFPAS